MSPIQDAWDDLRGKTARIKAEEQAEKQRLEAIRQSQAAEAFAETEGQGRASVGQVSLGLQEEEDEDMSNFLL